jgi:hypothetical protein
MQTHALCVALAGLTLGACVTTTTDSQSFRISKTSNVASAQVSTDADFSRYNNLMASELGIYFPQNHSTSVEDLQRIGQIFRDAFLTELEGYVIVTEPGPRTMAVEASLVDLRNSSSTQIPKMRTSIMDLAEPGSILFLMEMRDSVSGRVLARAADSAKAPTFSSADGIASDWASIEDAARHWAALFRSFLDENLAH